LTKAFLFTAGTDFGYCIFRIASKKFMFALALQIVPV